jgi:hypothetical protein
MTPDKFAATCATAGRTPAPEKNTAAAKTHAALRATPGRETLDSTRAIGNPGFGRQRILFSAHEQQWESPKCILQAFVKSILMLFWANFALPELGTVGRGWFDRDCSATVGFGAK